MATSATRSPSDWRDWKAAKAIIMNRYGASRVKRIVVSLAICFDSTMHSPAPITLASASDQTMV